MTRCPARLTLASLVLLLACGARADGVRDDAERKRMTDELFEQWNNADTPGCAVAVVRDGDVAHAAGFGAANLEHAVPITEETIFHIASISKQFVAFAVCLLVADGAVTLDDDVRTHVPEVPDFGRTITLRQLIHHRSGLRDQWDLLVLAGWRMDDVITRDDVMELVAAQRDLNFDPGTETLYCNTGYTLLGLVVERVTGMTLDEFCRTRVFEPLGMTRTHFHDDHRHLVPGRAECYWRDGDGYQKAVLSYAIAGATSLFTTVEDLARWEENFFTGAVGGPEVLELMEGRVTLESGDLHPYGMGIGHGMRGTRPTRSHGGGDAGFACFLLRFPEDHLSIAILANTPMPTARLAHEVAGLWLDDAESVAATPDAPAPAATESSSADDPEPPTPDRVTLDRAQLERLAGRYASAEPPIMIALTATDEGLDLRVGDESGVRLVPVSESSFRLEGDATGTADFAEDAGRVTSVKIAVNGMGTFVLERMEELADVDLTDYAGVYESPELAVRYELLVRDGDLMLRRRKHGTVPLAALGPDHFSGPFQVRFHRDDAGAVSGFGVTTGRVRDLQFVRTR